MSAGREPARPDGLVLYLSGPMTGYPEHNFPAFEDAATRLRSARYRVVSPHEIPSSDGSPPESLPWAEHLRADLALLQDANALAMLPDWERSAGAALEYYVAGALGWDIRPVDVWIEAARS